MIKIIQQFDPFRPIKYSELYSYNWPNAGNPFLREKFKGTTADKDQCPPIPFFCLLANKTVQNLGYRNTILTLSPINIE